MPSMDTEKRKYAVAYVKFPTASEAAKAQEELHMSTVKDGRATIALKVFIADEPERMPPWEAARCGAMFSWLAWCRVPLR